MDYLISIQKPRIVSDDAFIEWSHFFQILNNPPFGGLLFEIIE